MEQTTMNVLNDCQVEGRCEGCSSRPSQQPTKVGNDCQLQSLFEDTAPTTLRDRLRQTLLRLLTAGERRIDRLRRRLSPRAVPKSSPVSAGSESFAAATETVADAGEPILPGQWVEVLSYEEIQATLDAKHNCDGLEFMEGMQRYCGKRLRSESWYG